MPTKTVKPVTPLAKNDAEMDQHNRKIHPKYDEDVKRYGQRVSDYNAGWLAADTMHRKKSKRRAAKSVRA